MRGVVNYYIVSIWFRKTDRWVTIFRVAYGWIAWLWITCFWIAVKRVIMLRIAVRTI
jgi:hypothetical protein